MDFCTLGMFIIDDIYFPVPRVPVTNIVGGAGSYSALGARLFRQPPDSKRVSWTIHAGSDFPAGLRREIDSWETSCLFIDTPERLTTHSLNIYGENEYRGFEYTTPKKRIDETMLTKEQLLTKCFHLICAPKRCIQLVKGINARRSNVGAHLAPPIFVWEPVPDSCCPDEYNNILEALRVVHIVSPNHHELAAIFGEVEQLNKSDTSDVALLNHHCERLLAEGIRERHGAIVVRRGEKGCSVHTKYKQTFLPAYHQGQNDLPPDQQESCQQKVVDPTGGGNAFLGGFCVGLLDDCPEGTDKYEHAALLGSVAASFAIEQVGMPELVHRNDGIELWNNETVANRINAIRNREENKYSRMISNES